jgi:beta-lactam-binding protein with PASTA domain
MSLNEANRNLDEAGFLGADVVWFDDTTGAEAVVLRTEPQAGVLISPETPVTLFVGLAGS